MTEEDVRQLVAAGAREASDLEFKVSLYPIDSVDSKVRNEARRELFGDLIAMANSGDATLIIGIEEADEIAIAAPGVDAAQATEFVKKLPELLLRNVEPPLRSVQAEVLSIAGEGNLAFVHLMVRQSPEAPHRDASTRIFYERLGAQRVPMDIERVRTAFLRGELAYITFDEFRSKRIGMLSSSPLPNHTVDHRWWGSGFPVLCLHAAPLHALSRHAKRQIDFRRLKPTETLINAQPVDVSTYNAEGFLRYTKGVQDYGGVGFQVFHSGMYESISAGLLWQGKVTITVDNLVQLIRQSWTHIDVLNRELGESGWLVCISAWGLADANLGLPQRRLASSTISSAEPLICSEVRFDSFPTSVLTFAESISPSLQPLYTAFKLAGVELPLDDRTWK